MSNTCIIFFGCHLSIQLCFLLRLKQDTSSPRQPDLQSLGQLQISSAVGGGGMMGKRRREGRRERDRVGGGVLVREEGGVGKVQRKSM